jgi:hypothetical protein
MVMFILAVPIAALAQGTVQTVSADELQKLPLFSRGTSIVNLLPNVQFSSMNNGEDPKQVTTDFNINLRGNYYVLDNIAIVAGIHANSQNVKLEGFDDQKTSTTIFEIGGQYGRYFGDFPLRAEATVGFGSYNVFNNKAATFAYNINVATYLQLGQSGTYVEPFVGYAGFTNNFKEQEFKNNTGGLVLGATLVRPIGCGDSFCGFGDEAPASPYAAGTNRVQFLQTGVLGIGANNRLFNGESFSNDGLLGYAINLADYHYVVDNLAIGIGVQLDGLNTNDKNSDYKTSTLDFYATPRARYHAPIQGALNGLFAEGGVLFGSMVDKTTFNDGTTSENKTGTFGWNVGLGYDFYFTKNFSVTGLFEYVDKTHTNKETDVETKEKGTRFMLGMSYTFSH